MQNTMEIISGDSLAPPDDETGTMNRRDRNRLQRCRQAIVDDLEVKVIMDELIGKGILDRDCQEIIFSEKTTADRTRKLLDILPSRGPKAFSVFLDVLKEDYYWLVEQLENDSGSIGPGPDDADSGPDTDVLLQSILLKGGVPHEPSHCIARQEVLKEVKQGLANLKSGNFLVIHGMTGSGKSVLVADAVRDPDITLKYFPDGVFWFRVGMVEKDKLFTRMKILCEKLDAQTQPLSLEHAQEILRKLFISDRYSKSLIILDDVWSPDVIKSFNLSGRVLVTTQDVSVVDSVSSHSQIIKLEQGFTEEESLQLFSSYVDIPVEFLPEEARMIHVECKGSPMVISMIGGLISETGRFQHRQRQSGRWAYYLQNLKARKYSKFKKPRSYQHDSVMEAVMMSIENLDPKLKQRYRELAVFLDDVGIPAKNRQSPPITRWDFSLKSSQLKRSKGVRFGGIYDENKNKMYYMQMSYRGAMLLPFQVLMTYWEMDRFEVEDIMTEFLKKSLAQSEYDSNLESYVYSIHDLQLDYLKNQLREDNKKEREMHEKFLERYFRKANFSYGDIEDDSYIFSNISYHLFKSEQMELFPKIYLDLSFVEAMLKATGPVDLLNDYRKYEDHIMGKDNEYLEDLDDFEAFARTVGALVSNTPNTDIIQLALREPENSAVYKAAKTLALSRPERLYFEWSNRSQSRGRHLATILHHGEVEAAIFLYDMTKILTSNGDGQIKVWDVHSGEVLHRFTGHKSSVKTLALAPDGDKFASGSENGEVKLWDLGNFLDDSENSIEEQREVLRKSSMKNRSNSMKRIKQQTVNNLITMDHELRDLSNQSFTFNELHCEAVLSVAFSPDGEEIVACGQTGSIKVFNLKARHLRLTINAHNEGVNICCFSPKDGSLLCSGSDDTTVRIWTTDTGAFLGSNNRHQLRVLDVKFVSPDNEESKLKLISMSSDKLILWDFSLLRKSGKDMPMSGDLLSHSTSGSNLVHDVVEFKRTKDAYFQCMALANSGRILAAGTLDNLITIWNVENNQVLTSLPGHSQHIYVLNFTHDDSFLLSGSADETIMIWSMEEVCEESEKSRLSKGPHLSLGPSFDVKFFQDSTTRIVAPDDTNSVQFLVNGRLVFKTPSDYFRITAVALSKDGETVAYGCENGSVRLTRPSIGMVKHLGIHKGKVNDVKVSSDGVKVISAGDDKIVKIYHDGAKRFNCRGNSASVIEVHFFAEESLLLSRSMDESIRIWDSSKGEMIKVYEVPSNDHVTSIDGILSTSLLAVAKASGQVDILNLSTLEFITSLSPDDKSYGPVRVCRFSQDGSLLGVGYDCGGVETSVNEEMTRSRESGCSSSTMASTKKSIIQVWNVKKATKVYEPLLLHQSWVQDIVFNKDATRLVTVGDKIAWWNLDLATKKSKGMFHSASNSSNNNIANAPSPSPSPKTPTSANKRKTSQGKSTDLFSRRKRRSESDESKLVSECSSLNLSHSASATSVRGSKGFDENVIIKVGPPQNQELLQTFDIRGSSMNKIYADKDFKKFVTLDDAGIVYLLEEIEPVTFQM